MFHENGPVQSAAKALRLLGLLMEVHQPLTLAALSKQTGWPKSTIHGLLSAMRESASCRAAHWSPIRPRPSSRGRNSSV